MARIKFGMMMTDARGKLGGQVFTKTRSGATVRTKVTPTNPRSVAQSGVRSAFASLSSLWNTIPEEDRLSWNNATVLGASKNIFGDQYQKSGKNLFIGLNSNLLSAGAPINNAAQPPAILPIIRIDTATVLVETAFMGFNYDADFPYPNTIVVIEATAPQSAGKYNFSGLYRKLPIANSANFPLATATYTAYVAKFGAPVVGSKISFRIKVVNTETGQTSVPSVIDAVVKAM